MPENKTTSEYAVAYDYTIKQYMKFLIPSAIGVFLFLIPIKWNGNWTVMMGVLADALQVLFKGYLSLLVVLIFAVSIIMTVFTKVFKPEFVMTSNVLKPLFDVKPFGIVVRVISLIFGILVFFQAGPQVIWSEYTGGTALGLIEILTIYFLVAGFLIPLLLDYGVMEFVGVMVRSIMKPLFTIPGRSTLDTIASWIGSGTVGVVITSIQYDEGYYTKREASVIAVCFSIVSVPFALVFASSIGLPDMFIQMYFVVSVACFVAAIILPRIPPLSKKPDTYYEPVGKQINEVVPENVSKFRWGLDAAIKKADTNTSASETIKRGTGYVLDVWMSLMPLVMVIATIALIIAEFTSVFTILAMPLVPILEFLQIPEAAEAAPAFIVGFIDVFLPIIIGGDIASEFTRFVIVCLASTQLIFMTENGPILMRSNIGLTFVQLLILFILRTIITLPIIIILARLFFF